MIYVSWLRTEILNCSELGYDWFLDRETIQSSFVVANVYKHAVHIASIKERTLCYTHDVGTFNAIWRQVGEATQTRWQARGTIADIVGIDPNSSLKDENSRLLFTVTRIE